MNDDCHQVHVLGKDGKLIQTFQHDKLFEPTGVATGPDGAIYVTSNCSLLKFSKAGRLLKTVEKELCCPQFMKTIKNRIYVADSGKNQVKIFDMDCNVIGIIPTNECPEPYDIAAGDDGLYVLGSGKIGVYSCAPNGNFKRHVNIDTYLGRLSTTARAICFDCNGHLFVTEYGGNIKGVHVFKPSGEDVTYFLLPNNYVSSWNPAGIVIDEDGFVYVCNFVDGDEKIYVF